MPSAPMPARDDHADPGPPGRVIHLGRRTSRSGQGRRTPQPVAPERAVASTPQQRLAETAEAWFLARGATLTDDRTAEVYRTTLDLTRLMLDGSLSEGLVGEDEHRHLAAMVEGLRGAPDSL